MNCKGCGKPRREARDSPPPFAPDRHICFYCGHSSPREEADEKRGPMNLEPGDRVELLKMIDPYPVPKGTLGTVTGEPWSFLNGDGTRSYVVPVDWDDGRALNLSVPPDEYRKVKPNPSEAEREAEYAGRKNWNVNCQVCGEKPTVGDLALCGPCCFGEAATHGGNW